MKRHKHKILFGALIIAILALVFWYGGDAPGLRGWISQTNDHTVVTKNDAPVPPASPMASKEPAATPVPTESVVIAAAKAKTEPEEQRQSENDGQKYPEGNGMIIDDSTGKDRYFTDPVPEGKPLPVEPQDQSITNQEYTCFLSVRCDTILNNMTWLDPEKIEMVPADGVIFAEREVSFYEGESVFQVLLREMKQNKIHMEYENTPIYNSAYIEGIANLYEFDCGELSGWMYKVNGWFPNYGCSRYQLQSGDRIEWVYTCDLGADVGGSYSAGNGG
ncbi:MAG: DUF4430 domain-containing protein [Clostridia bacterium]|nr:DUF4430 domain-containing protein [Clostridia bacterium]